MIIHTPSTFLKFGWKQWTTWVGLILLVVFGCLFHTDIHTLIHNVLTSNSLAEKIITGIGGVAFIAFNRFNSNSENKSNDNNSST